MLSVDIDNDELALIIDSFPRLVILELNGDTPFLTVVFIHCPNATHAGFPLITPEFVTETRAVRILQMNGRGLCESFLHCPCCVRPERDRNRCPSLMEHVEPQRIAAAFCEESSPQPQLRDGIAEALVVQQRRFRPSTAGRRGG